MALRMKRDKFPLWLHPTGQYGKKIKGRYYYFGKDKDAALAEYVRTRDDLLAGRKPRPKADDAASVADLCNKFLTSKRQRVDSGELSARMWGEYHKACETIVEAMGEGRAVDDLRPDDFGELRAKAAKRLGSYALGKYVQLVKTVFHFAYSSELIDRPIRYGDQFDKPAAKSLRLARAKRGVRLIDAADVRKLHDHADAQLRAIVLLAMNCGFGPADCAGLNRSHLKAREGWVYFPRPKTGIDRRIPLWPETVKALAAARKVRPTPHDTTDADAFFLTRQGRRLSRFIDRGELERGVRKDSLSPAFNKLVKRAGVTINGGLYVLRHTFRTVADEIPDRAAIDAIMGHSDDSMGATYRERIDDARLVAVTECVRAWMFGTAGTVPRAEHDPKREKPVKRPKGRGTAGAAQT